MLGPGAPIKVERYEQGGAFPSMRDWPEKGTMYKLHNKLVPVPPTAPRPETADAVLSVEAQAIGGANVESREEERRTEGSGLVAGAEHGAGGGPGAGAVDGPEHSIAEQWKRRWEGWQDESGGDEGGAESDVDVDPEQLSEEVAAMRKEIGALLADQKGNSDGSAHAPPRVGSRSLGFYF